MSSNAGVAFRRRGSLALALDALALEDGGAERTGLGRVLGIDLVDGEDLA